MRSRIPNVANNMSERSSYSFRAEEALDWKAKRNRTKMVKSVRI